MKERNRRNVPPVLRTGGTILSKKPEEKHVIATQRGAPRSESKSK